MTSPNQTPHPEYGPCDSIADGKCAECMRIGVIPYEAPKPSLSPAIEELVEAATQAHKELEDYCATNQSDWTRSVRDRLRSALAAVKGGK